MMRALESFFVAAVRRYKIIIMYHRRKRLHYDIDYFMVFLSISLISIFSTS